MKHHYSAVEKSKGGRGDRSNGAATDFVIQQAKHNVRMANWTLVFVSGMSLLGVLWLFVYASTVS
ncbi:MAG: hypothetical protein AWU57_330 [Marinobacter sp. T13-3]|nr:MAG: hypothetical protein AWU57_330 [Marinobacter sp. T13-3]